MAVFTPLNHATTKRRVGLAVAVAALFVLSFALGYALHP